MKDSTQTEQLAVAHIIEVFSSCKRICPYINIGDKEPLWDGSLFLYDSDEHNNDTLCGRVPCQVKGRAVSADPERVSFYLTKEAISNYLRDGGVLFFLVYVDNMLKPSYWAKLTPLKLRQYLKNLEKSGNKGTSVEFSRLPQGLVRCEAETFDFYQHCQLQKAPPVGVDQLTKFGNHFRLFGVSRNGEYPIVSMSKGFHYIYLCDEKDNITNVVGDSEFSLQLYKAIDDRILIGSKEFMLPIKMVVSTGAVCLEVGDFLRVDLTSQEGKERKITFSVDSIKGVRQRATAFQVLLALDESSEFSFPSLPSIISCETIRIQEEMREAIQGELSNMLKVVKLLDRLHITSDLDLNSLLKKDLEELNTLYQAIMENKMVNLNLSGHDVRITNINIGKLKILVWLIKDKNGYYVRDFFSPIEQDIIASDSESGEVFSISRFSVLEAKDYMYTSNIDWTLIPSDFKNLRIDVPGVVHCVNKVLLNLLTAYDKVGRKESLQAALRLSNWLMETINDAPESIMLRINNLQTIKRIRQLSEDELQEITRYSEDPDASLELKYCCNLLLDDQRRAKLHFTSLPKDKQAFYKTLPISHFKQW